MSSLNAVPSPQGLQSFGSDTIALVSPCLLLPPRPLNDAERTAEGVWQSNALKRSSMGQGPHRPVKGQAKSVQRGGGGDDVAYQTIGFDFGGGGCSGRYREPTGAAGFGHTHTHTHTAECTICTGQVWRPPCRLDCAPHPTQPPMLAEGQGEGGWHPVAIKSRRLTAEQPWCCWTLEVWLSTCCPREFVQGHAICRSFPHYAHLLS
mmetsp:Transcript_77410/g.129173  ORF Transcript_77410/g.129173 Transcript_77410/m.129173 type:complete len:206 (-) Transcript_77410:1266-1883(-)